MPHWTSDQNLVPKSSHEVEERKQIETGWWGWIRRFAPRVSVISDSAAMMPLKCLPFLTPLLPPSNESFWQKCFLNPPCKLKWLLFHYLNLNWACSQNLEYSMEKIPVLWVCDFLNELDFSRTIFCVEAWGNSTLTWVTRNCLSKQWSIYFGKSQFLVLF